MVMLSVIFDPTHNFGLESSRLNFENNYLS